LQRRAFLFVKARVGLFIDGSNLLSSLARIDLGYPNLRRLLDHLIAGESLVHARFYGAPPVNAPAGRSQINYYAHWMRFVAAQRTVPMLDFYHGYRDKLGKEKSVDVALAVDLLFGACRDIFDRAIVVGGDGDHQYAVEVAKTLVPVAVVVIEGQRYSGMKRTGVNIRELKRADIVKLRICANGYLAPTPG
jgi:uncharacterized LabA/DUF88 family protein